MKTLEVQRRELVQYQLENRGINDQSVLRAMGEVPRDEFVPEQLRESAYYDGALPIGSEQTISQPFIVAAMIQALALEPGDRVLEVGAGSGYSAALMSRIVDKVYAIERHGELVERARERIRRLGYDNIEIKHGDGTRGWPEAAPFDAIVVAAAAPEVPSSLTRQLTLNGRMVIPVGTTQREQRLIQITRTGKDKFDERELEQVRFVPLIGVEGWTSDVERGR